MRSSQRYRIFFSPEKFAPHSLTRFLESCFFFIFTCRKKKTLVFFFCGKVCKPLTRQKNWDLQKKVKKGKKLVLFAVFQFLEVFFFSRIVFFLLLFFFFPGKVYTSLTHSISKPGKKKTGQKKKTPFSLTHSIFAKKWSKTNFSGKKNTVPLIL